LILFLYMIVKVKINNPIGNLYRKNHALILIKQGDKYVLGLKKHFYPANFARMIGGGINEGESPKAAAIREVKEELNYQTESVEYIATLKTIANTAQGEMIMTTHIYFLEIPFNTQLEVGDDVTGLKYYTEQELQKLIFGMSQLTGTYHGEDYLFHFDWEDYGKIYEPIHQIAFEYAKNNNYC
jgi:8-oxo-dGTP pyrophosphatase MutT (NUDIX family)